MKSASSMFSWVRKTGHVTVWRQDHTHLLHEDEVLWGCLGDNRLACLINLMGSNLQRCYLENVWLGMVRKCSAQLAKEILVQYLGSNTVQGLCLHRDSEDSLSHTHSCWERQTGREGGAVLGSTLQWPSMGWGCLSGSHKSVAIS